jgi:hypothetical protein
MTALTLAELKTELVSDAAETCGFKSTRQFLDVWKSAGYRTLRPSPRKRVVYVADVAKFLSERIEPLTQPMETHV